MLTIGDADLPRKTFIPYSYKDIYLAALIRSNMIECSQVRNNLDARFVQRTINWKVGDGLGLGRGDLEVLRWHQRSRLRLRLRNTA